MAALTVQKASHNVAVTPSAAACTEAGDTFSNDGRTFLRFDNGHVSDSYTVTIASLVADNFGVTNDVSFVVPSGGVRVVGPFNPNRFNNSGVASITYSVAPADMTVEVIRLQNPG